MICKNPFAKTATRGPAPKPRTDLYLLPPRRNLQTNPAVDSSPSHLHIDLETYSSVDIRASGVYPYTESFDFEILLFGYAFDDEPVRVVDLAGGEQLPSRVEDVLLDPDSPVTLWAHNAIFERRALARSGFDIPPERWNCTAILSSYCGLPLRLAQVSEALDLDEFGKSSTGTSLIRYFCVPCRPTKTNGQRHRNLPHHAPDKWAEFKEYCRQDVVAEREIHRRLAAFHAKMPAWERRLQVLDQRINDRGVLLDLDLAGKAQSIDARFCAGVTDDLQQLTGLDNPNSGTQMRDWLTTHLGWPVTSIAKGVMDELREEAADNPLVSDVLDGVASLSKSSTSKYAKMFDRASADSRARGLLQHYGASTGRWAGRGIQPQNLPRNYLKDMDGARRLLKAGDYGAIMEQYPDVPGYLSQLIRTAIAAPPGKLFAVADFSAIEARVLAWLAGEEWVMEVFRTHGKIYEATASRAFGIPLEEVTKDSPWREKGKTLSLACGFGGSVGAVIAMGGDKLGLSEGEMKSFVDLWRKSNPNIVSFWYHLNDLAMRAMHRRGKTVRSDRTDLAFAYDGTWLICRLPSKRCLFYYKPKFYTNKFGQKAIQYLSIDSTRGNQLRYVGTYGGKLAENITQAVARDLLANSLLELDASGFPVVLHVHDEAISEIPEDRPAERLAAMCEIMERVPDWATHFPLKVAGFTTPYYLKD